MTSTPKSSTANIACRRQRELIGLPFPKSNCDLCGSILRPNWKCPLGPIDEPPNVGSGVSPPVARLSPNDVQRRSRLDLCRSADAFVRAVEGMAVSDEMKGEIANMVRLAQRMALRVNDGHVSPAEPMRTW